MRALFSWIAGVLFALGLGISGMTDPANVQGFLDFAGDWKPALALVMGGGVLTYGVAFRVIQKRPAPLLGGFFQIPTKRDLDLRLILGAALFGAGWGLGGFCPGPAFVSLATGAGSVLVFIGTMLVGMYAFQLLDPALQEWEARRARRA